eukprot:UN30874
MVKKTSKYRHVWADDPKPEFTYTDLPKPYTSGESSYASASHKFWAVAKAGAGGPVIVRPLEKFGRVTAKAPVLNTHDGKVLDLQFSPWNGSLLATASEDAHIHLHNIPKEGLTENVKEAWSKMGGGRDDHQKKVALIKWNRVANNILASGSYDRTVKIYDVSTSQVLRTFDKLEDNIYSLVWNGEGTELAVSAKTKTRHTSINIFDPRAQENAVCIEQAFQTKAAKLFMCPTQNFIGGVGYTKNAKRIMKLWDRRDTSKEAFTWEIDNASSVLMPHFDEDLNILWLYGKGDNTILFAEIGGSKGYTVLGAQRGSGNPTKGGAWLPKRGCDVMKCEVARFFKLTQKELIPLQFRVPRKSTLYQPDIYPKTYNGKTSVEATEWNTGENGKIERMSMDPEDGENVDSDQVIVKKMTYQELQEENTKLKARVAELEEKLGIKPEPETEEQTKDE